MKWSFIENIRGSETRTMVMLPYSLGSFKNLSSCFETYEENGYRCHSDYGSMNTFLGSFIFCIYYQRVMGRREGFLRQVAYPTQDGSGEKRSGVRPKAEG